MGDKIVAHALQALEQQLAVGLGVLGTTGQHLIYWSLAWRTFVQAAATCLSNPKAAVFMLAVVPQFLRPEHGPLAVQALAMALITALTQVLVYGGVALGAAGLRARLAGSTGAQVAAARAVGGLLLATAAWALLTGWRTG